MTPSTTSPDGARRALRALTALLFWLLVWHLAAGVLDWRMGGRGNELLLPYPLTVLTSLLELAATASFWQTVALSLLRILAGLAAGTLLGVLLAAATSASRWAHRLLSPAIQVVRATPVASFIMLVLLWVYTGRVPTVIAALMVLPVIWANVSRGIGETDPQLLELARAYRFGRWKTLRLVYLPGALPYFTAGLTTAVGLAWKSGVAAEVLCQPRFAIGTQVFKARNTLETPQLFAWTITVILLSLLLEGALTAAIGRLGRRRGG